MKLPKEKMICSVAIATFNRRSLLRELINSLFNQKGIENVLLEIIIVDNDAKMSGKSIVEEFTEISQVKIKYYCQPQQNISLTRNIALKKSKGQYIAIIDDDETADEYWLKSILQTAIKYEADAVFGYVIPRFPPETVFWMQQREIYFQPMGKTGDKPLFRYTTNCIIKIEFIKKNNLRFNPKYGLSGGEDGIFFDQMAKHGAKFVVCREAISYEVIPEYRTTLKFIFNRFYQRGNNYGRYYMEFHNNKYQQARIWLLFKSIIASMYFGASVILLFPIKKKWIFSFINFSNNIGKVSALINLKSTIYKNEINKFLTNS